MTAVSRQECHELAALARLSLDDAEAERFAAQLGPILDYLEQLQGVDVADGPTSPSAAVAHAGLRDDLPAPPLTLDQALAGAPAVRDDQVIVPKFKED